MNIVKYIEHTLLAPNATKKDLIKLFDEAIKYNFYGVCVNPINVKLASNYLKNTDVRGVYDIEEETSDPIIMRNMTEDFYVNLLANNKKYKNPKKAMKAIIDL